MAELENDEKVAARREKKARSMASLGLVNRVGDRFRVTAPCFDERRSDFEVWRDDGGIIRCDCDLYSKESVTDPKFRCEHLLAVKFAVAARNTESGVRNLIRESAKSPAKAVSNSRKTISQQSNAAGSHHRQRTNDKSKSESAADFTFSKNDRRKEPAGVDHKSNHLKDEKGEVDMKKTNNLSFETANSIQTNNVLDFTSTLRELRHYVDPNVVKQRQGGVDRNGNVQIVEYLEWFTVADILDQTAPNWTYAIRDVKPIGDIVAVTAAITIDGVTREGIGTSTPLSEYAIRKAEHEALTRAAVKFGIARELYEKESDSIEFEDNIFLAGKQHGGLPENPIAATLSDLVTAKQLGMIRAISREIGIRADDECLSLMNCRTDELSRSAASGLIKHLQNKQHQPHVGFEMPLRRAG